MLRDYLSILLQIIVSVGFVASALIASVVLGRAGRRSATKDTAYECGMVADTGGMARFSVKFYLVAMLFILFDIEVVFMYPWAVVYRQFVQHTELGFFQRTEIFWSMLSFVFVLTVGYVYAIKKGALEWKK